MKKISLLVLGLFAWTLTFSQVNVRQLFSQHPEVVIKFQIQDRSQLETLTRMISIDNVTENEVIAYTVEEEFEQFLTLNIPYEIVERVVLTPEELNMLDFEAIQKHRNDWNYYPDYQAYLDMMQQFAIDYPDLCRLVEFGTSVQNRKLWALVLSKNVHVREAEPQVFFSSSMHGDELTGYVLMLRYIDYLLENYGTNTQVTNLLDNMEIWVTPLANPDGTFWSSGARRGNANNVDLNRNYKDWKYGDHPDGKAWQKETLAFMDLQAAETFVLSANIHGGAEVFNFTWDNTCTLPADYEWWKLVSKEYVDMVHTIAPSYMNGNFCSYCNPPWCYPGVCNGASWYSVSGSRQDYANYYNYTREFCLEISNTKTPNASQLPTFWNRNYQSFLNYTQQALYGIQGVVTDAYTGEPVYAKIFINGHDIDNSFVMTDPRVGYYARLIKSGTYSVTYSADGYESQTVSVTVTDYQKTATNISLIPTGVSLPVANFEADITEVFVNEIVLFKNLSENATAWEWYFEGGTPETSAEQNPTVLYEEQGSFDVKLKALNGSYSDEMLMENYITVKPEILLPIADFEADKTKIYENGIVNFTNLSENVAAWEWHFEGGTPETSTEQNPAVVYEIAGIYSVTLEVKNEFGEDSLTKEDYIIVFAPNFPIADFEADKTHITAGESVHFANHSENATTYEWYFEGGTPETSAEENPTVVYENAGSFNVKLTVSNTEGNDDMLKEDYIIVTGVSIKELEGVKVKVFPNPVSRGATVTIDADLPVRKIEWISMSGTLIKTVYADAASYTFSVSDIEPGAYLLKIETAKGFSVTKIQVQ
ncbi:MAG: PKD domain-containing protein [Bacteroidales bacterium]|nr:PKD domain-containing protein [Bacteroidales bacterium]